MFVKVLTAVILLFSSGVLHCQIYSLPTKKVMDVANIHSFAIFPDGQKAVAAITNNSITNLYLIEKMGESWGTPKSMDAINGYLNGASIIASPFISYDGAKLYFHANFSDSHGGTDIYVSEWDGNKWSNPKNVGKPVNSENNEECPSIVPTGYKIFFTRPNQTAGSKRAKEAMACKLIFYSSKDHRGQWESPVMLPEVINFDCEATPFIAPDGKTLYFSSQRGDTKSGFDLYYAKEIFENAWTIPTRIDGFSGSDDELSPTFLNGNLYFLHWVVKKKQYTPTTLVGEMPSDFHPEKLIPVSGRISDLNTQKPLNARLLVLNPVSSKRLGEYYSSEEDGNFSFPLFPGNAYHIEVRKNEYSFSTFTLDFTENVTTPKPIEIQLYNKIQLVLSVYDSEIFKPLTSTVKILNSQGLEFSAEISEMSLGKYKLALPIGENYVITVSSKGFHDHTFNFSLKDDIVFSEFERYISLEPSKTKIDINIADFETSHGIDSVEIVIVNLSRDEVITLSAKDVKEGKATVMLREGDKYEFNIKGPKGYAFYNNTIDLQSESEKRTLDVELKPLNAQTILTLNNITFEYNSADLNDDSFAELDRVVTLIKDNESIIVEISAHTDDRGTDYYNNKLSERRAESVVGYLKENGVPENRLIASGYGKSKPLVPNTSDENRAINRRVEFKIVGFVSGTE
jgi:outer membrane protein OmpA-like peptidoglycan-associated protein